MLSIFRFKQFAVDQTNCAMKINTDGVLLGALAKAEKPANIVDIGSGTGVIGLMLAQRFKDAMIQSVEIDAAAAQTSQQNFNNSPFAGRLQCHHLGFNAFFESYPNNKFDLIVSNPPFHVNALSSPEAAKSLAKHTDKEFFEQLISHLPKHLAENGSCWLILPVTTAAMVKNIAARYGLFEQAIISILSFEHSESHREIVVLSLSETNVSNQQFVIYDEPKIYSRQYQEALGDFFTIF